MKHPILQFFEFNHLPDELKAVSLPFHAMAYNLEKYLPDSPEKTVALRKLLESKDAAVRATIYKDPRDQDQS